MKQQDDHRAIPVPADELARLREVWRPVHQYESCYEVSNLGRVRAIHKRNRYAQPSVRPLKQNHSIWGYRVVSLCKDGVRSMRSVHRLVLESFVGVRPENMEAAHLDGDKDNNRIDNLQWVTHKENMQHLVIHGTAPKQHTSCKNGHLMSADNLYLSKGERRCKTCAILYGSKRDRSNKTQARAALAKSRGEA